MKTEQLKFEPQFPWNVSATFGVVKDANNVKGLSDLVTIQMSLDLFEDVYRGARNFKKGYPDFPFDEATHLQDETIAQIIFEIHWTARERMVQLLFEEVDLEHLSVSSLQAIKDDCEEIYNCYVGNPDEDDHEEWIETLEDTISYLDHRINPPPITGYVYLLRSSSGHWKIGRTVNPKDSIKTFSVKLPFEVEYEHLIPCSDHIKAELQLHDLFASKRVNGEWFSLSEEDVTYIKQIVRIGP